MKRRACKVHIVNNQKIGSESDKIEVDTNGLVSEINNNICLSYKEDNNNYLSILKIYDKTKMELIKNKPYECKLVIEKDTINRCLYATGYGNLDLEVEGKFLNYKFSDTTGVIELKYNLYIDSNKVSENNMNINIDFS